MYSVYSVRCIIIHIVGSRQGLQCKEHFEVSKNNDIDVHICIKKQFYYYLQ